MWVHTRALAPSFIDKVLIRTSLLCVCLRAHRHIGYLPSFPQQANEERPGVAVRQVKTREHFLCRAISCK